MNIKIIMEENYSLADFQNDDKFNDYLESLEELPEDDINNNYRSKMHELWLKSENNESSSTLYSKRSKLKVADNNQDVFYLSKSKINKNKIDKERQNNRLLFQCRKQAEGTLPKRNKMSIDKILKESRGTVIMSQKELEIESSLFTPYVNDEKAVQNLFDNVKKIKETKKLDELKKRKLFLDNILKSRIQAELNQLIREEEARKKLEMKLLESKEIKLSNVDIRKRQWILFIITLNSSKKIRDIVFSTRKLKEQNKKIWKCVILIQKVYRKWIQNKKNPKNENNKLTLYEQIKISMDKDGSREVLYKSRVQCANLIIFLLKNFNKTFKPLIRAYLLKVRWIERKIKYHFVHTGCRKIAMKNLIDRFLRALIGHVFVVLIGKGLDINRSLELDQKLIDKYCKSQDNSRIVESMYSKEFHKYLRKKLNSLELTGYKFNQGQKFILDPIILNKALEDYIFASRKKHIIKSEQDRQIKINIPIVTTDDVRTFILGGSDPLKSYLVDFKRQTDEYLEQLNCSGVVVAKHRNLDVPKKLRLFHINPSFLFYSKITAFELIDIVIDVLDRMHRKAKATAASNRFIINEKLHEEKQILPKIIIDEYDIKNHCMNEHVNANFPIGEQIPHDSENTNYNSKDNNNYRPATPPKTFSGTKKMFRKIIIKQST